jgi:hypothetical protein
MPTLSESAIELKKNYEQNTIKINIPKSIPKY